MKILYYSSYFLPYTSGITTTTYNILDHLGKKHSISLLTFRHDPKLKKEERMGKITVFRMLFNLRVSKGFISFSSLFYFLRSVKTADVVVVNLPNVEAFLLVLLAKLSGKKVIVLFHCDIQLEGGIGARLVTAITRFATFLQLVLADTVVAYPDYLSGHWYEHVFKNKLKMCLPVFQKPTVNVAYKRDLQKKKQHRVWIGFVGRIAREKGLEYLIQASELLKKKGLNFELVFVGPKDVVGETSYRDKIMKMLKRDSIPHLFLGMLLRSELGAFYQTVDVVVVPSINRTEGISIAQLEAMTEGTPVVVSSLPGVRYPVQKTGMGLTVSPRNIQALADGLLTVTQNKNRFSNKENIQKANSLFSSRKVLKCYDDLFR